MSVQLYIEKVLKSFKVEHLKWNCKQYILYIFFRDIYSTHTEQLTCQISLSYEHEVNKNKSEHDAEPNLIATSQCYSFHRLKSYFEDQSKI